MEKIKEVRNSMEVTIKDIARKANVSYATVSRALNNKRGVRESTRHRVLALAAEMSYTPNAIARGLVKKQTQTLGLIIPDITNPFYPEVARGIEDGAADQGFSIFLCNTNWEREREVDYLRLLAEKRVDGIILAPIDNEVEAVEHRLAGKIPVVYVSNAPHGTSLGDSWLQSISYRPATGESALSVPRKIPSLSRNGSKGTGGL